MKTLFSDHLLTACRRLLQLVVVANFIMGCSTTDNETEAIVLIGEIVEIHDVAAAVGISRHTPPRSPLLPTSPTQENIAKVRQSIIDSGRTPPSDVIIEFIIYQNSYSRTDIPAEPAHKLYVVESVQRKKFYVRSTEVFVVGTCVEIRPQPVHREKNSWLLGEATTKASTRC